MCTPPKKGIWPSNSPSACQSANGNSDPHFWSVNAEGSAIQQTNFPVSYLVIAPRCGFMLATKNAWCPLATQWVLIYEYIICLKSAPTAVICLLRWKDQRGSFLPHPPRFEGCPPSSSSAVDPALKSWMFARSLFLPSHDFRTLPAFSAPVCYEGTTRKSRACIIPISMAAKCTKPIFSRLDWSARPTCDPGNLLQFFNSSIFAIFSYCSNLHVTWIWQLYWWQYDLRKWWTRVLLLSCPSPSICKDLVDSAVKQYVTW